ncbi:hypothetical protein FRC10_004411, partial [Ceratobasidium sp. 414]
MDSGLVDHSSPEAMSRGSDRRPSLTPSRVEESLSSESTITLPPLPPSPEHTPSLHTTHPSIEPEETVYTDLDLAEGGVPPSHIISHDVNRLVQYPHDIDTVREGETRDMSDHLQHIEEGLFHLPASLHRYRPTPPALPQYIPYPVQVPAPAPTTAPAPAPAPAPTLMAVPVPLPVPVLVAVPIAMPAPAPMPARQPLPIPPRPVVKHVSEEYEPMSDTSFDVSLYEREEEPTPVAAPIPPRPASKVASIDHSESIESMSDRASVVPDVTLSDESSVLRSVLSSLIIT